MPTPRMHWSAPIVTFWHSLYLDSFSTALPARPRDAIRWCLVVPWWAIPIGWLAAVAFAVYQGVGAALCLFTVHRPHWAWELALDVPSRIASALDWWVERRSTLYHWLPADSGDPTEVPVWVRHDCVVRSADGRIDRAASMRVYMTTA